MRASYNFNKQNRLRKHRQFEETYTRGRRVKGPRLIIFYKPNQLGFSRLGLSTSKKRFKLSTERHYIQRRLREIYRLNKQRFLPGYDIVISAQRFDRDQCRPKDITDELLTLARRGNLLRDGG